MYGSKRSLVFPSKYFRTSPTKLTVMTSNIIGFTKVVIPTPMAQPVIPNPLPWARKSLGKISVGTKKATVPQVAA
jgi:hypothetical protein